MDRERRHTAENLRRRSSQGEAPAVDGRAAGFRDATDLRNGARPLNYVPVSP